MQRSPKTIEIKKWWRKNKRYYAIIENGGLVSTSSNANKVKGFIDYCKHRQIKVVGDIDH